MKEGVSGEHIEQCAVCEEGVCCGLQYGCVMWCTHVCTVVNVCE